MYNDDRLDAVRRPDNVQVSGNHYKKARVSGARFHEHLSAPYLAQVAVCGDTRDLRLGKRGKCLTACHGPRRQRDLGIRRRRLESLYHRRISSRQARHPTQARSSGFVELAYVLSGAKAALTSARLTC